MFETYESGGARNTNANLIGNVTDKYSINGIRSEVMKITMPANLSLD